MEHWFQHGRRRGRRTIQDELLDKEPDTWTTKWGDYEGADESSQVVYDDGEKGDTDGSRKQGWEF